MILLCFTLQGIVNVNAQVSIGGNSNQPKIPESFSILELVSAPTAVIGGLRLPQLTEADKTSINSELAGKEEAKGLFIYNIEKNQVEYWDGTKWIAQGAGVALPWQDTGGNPLIRTTDVGMEADIYHVGGVTIGSTEASAGGALLQLKNIEGITDNAANAHKGLGFPRVALSKKNELYPMFLNDPANPASGSKSEYTAQKATLDKTHAGLIVYNVVENEKEELYTGLCQWDGEKWENFSEKMGNALFDPVKCEDIIAGGAFVEGKLVDASNFLTIRLLNVTRPGSYSIKATTTNGYNFYVSGVAVSKGEMVLNIPCQGMPINVGTDVLTFEGLKTVNDCPATVEVLTAVATYSLNCSSIAFNPSAQFTKGKPLTSAHNMTMYASVSTPGSYSIKTPTVNGIYFGAVGEFTSTGTQPITLLAHGTPTVTTDFQVPIQANTPSGNAECSATISMTLARMTVAIIGRNIWSWAEGARYNALINTASFGPDGKVKIEGITVLWITPDAGPATTRLTSGYTGTPHANSGTGAPLNWTNAFPDVVLYFAFDSSPTPALATALSNYINRGGVVIYGSRDDQYGEVNTILTGVFGSAYATAVRQSGGSGDDNVYPINILPNCPIVNGPFGNCSGQHWGEDNAQTGSIILTNLPPSSVQICSAVSTTNTSTSADPDRSIVWYSEIKNFLYFGDSTGTTTSDMAPGAYPSLFVSYLPKAKNYGPGGNTRLVYNAHLELNGVAWALRKAAVSGINPY